MKPSVKLTILEAMVKDYKNCYFTVGVDEKFIVEKKRGDSN